MKYKVAGILLFLVTLSIFYCIVLRNDKGRGGISQAPEYQGIFPGTSTKEDLILSLGEPNTKKFNFYNWATTYIYEYDFTYLKNDKKYTTKFSTKYILKHGVVEVIERNMYVGAELGEILKPEQLFKIYGEPEEVYWSKLDPPMWAILYCGQGIIAHGNTNHISYIYYFVPVSQSECLRQFKSVVSETDPYYGTDILMIKDPWGFSN